MTLNTAPALTLSVSRALLDQLPEFAIPADASPTLSTGGR